MKKLALMLAVSLAAPVFAAVPLRWTVDTSRVVPAVFEVVRGETVELEAAFNSYGKPLEMSGKVVSIFWQTNGMAEVWWSAPATAASNTVTAAFTPAMDPGAATVSGFLGVPGEIYRAAFVLRFRHGPGAVPNELELPRKSIDFATVEVANAPWADKTVVDNIVDYNLPEIETLANSAYNTAKEANKNAKLAINTAEVARVTADTAKTTADAANKTAEKADKHATSALSGASNALMAINGHINTKSGNPHKVTAEDVETYTKNEIDLKTEIARSAATNALSVANTAKESAHAAETAVMYAQNTADDAMSIASDAEEKAEKAQQDVGEVLQIMAGEDFRQTITNYGSKVHAPTLSMEARYSDGTSQKWATVWTETNGLARTKRETLAEVKSNHYSKAESDARYKAWGKYDSETGEAAPEGFTQISAPGGLIIGADAGWKNYLSASGGSYWIWRGNGNITTSQETGMLEIIDADGNAVFTVVKGDKTLESAAAASISSTTDGMSDIVTIAYNVDAKEAPVIEWSAELKPAAWYKQTDDGFPGTVVWESENNTKWTATVTLPASGRGFFRATYYKGADSYIRAAKAMAIDKITVGGKTYTLGVGEINGTKVLTLK